MLATVFRIVANIRKHLTTHQPDTTRCHCPIQSLFLASKIWNPVPVSSCIKKIRCTAFIMEISDRETFHTHH